MKTAVEQKDKYALYNVNMIDFYPEDGNRNYPDDIEKIISRIKFLNKIGYEIEPLISTALSFEGNAEKVKLTGDYRVIVPQSIINRGMSLAVFMEYLSGELLSHHNKSPMEIN